MSVRAKIRRPFARRAGRLEILTNGWRRQAFFAAPGEFSVVRCDRRVWDVSSETFGRFFVVVSARSGRFCGPSRRGSSFSKREGYRANASSAAFAFRRLVFRKIETIFFRVSTVERLSLSRRVFIKRRRTRRFLIFLYSFGERRSLSERAETPKRSFLI